MPKDEEGHKRVFVPGPGDGPQYKFSKEKKAEPHIPSPHGKNTEGPPISYLPIPVWATKKEIKKELGKNDKGAKTERGSFIDDIFFYGKKNNLPGPGRYFAETKKEAPKKSEKSKDGKKEDRPTFLMDYQYLGMNFPGPGEYRMRDTWAEIANKKKHSGGDEKKKQSYVAQSWRVKNDQGHGPGQYDIVRLMTLSESKGEGGKVIRKFQSIPIFERPKFGVINKGHNVKKTSGGSTMTSTSPGSYFKGEYDLEKAYKRLHKPMRRY